MAVPKLRFKEFDGDWSAQKYKDALTIKYGKDHKLLEDGEIPVYGTGGVMRYVNQYLYDGESILIGRKGTIDQPKYVNEKFWTVDTLFYSEIKQNIYPLFIYQHALQVNWLGLNEATGVPSLNTTSINNVDIYLPSKEEQTKIASFLSNVDEKISQLTQKHELLSQYKQGMMQKLFSQRLRFKADDGSEFGEWKFIKLNQLGKSYNGLTGKTKDDFGNGDAYVTYKQIFDNRKINLQKIDKVNIQPHETQNRVIKGDLFFTTSSEIPEEVAYCSAILDDFDYPLYLNSFCFGFRPNNQNQLNSNYASFFFRSNQFRNTILHLAQGSTRFNISKTAFMDMKIALPRVEEQTKIANFLSAIDQKIEVVAQQIEQAKQWKKGLLQQMFV
ncbi:restriction endonuclease subunit S [Acinetobacter towneri]|uniref:restriction endonuclease subunit S n=1 Tax=Acinetobacter towneri TaxID=202956 RepID=UPI00209AD2F3|nr:restriction endonuclease subunit S [Acinetobacter towneri]MCO8055818.1 restriction endonuclease subunit S [Acinetobacter towneri]